MVRKSSKEDHKEQKVKIGKENVEVSYSTLRGSPWLLFSGDPLKKGDEFIWTAKLDTEARIMIRLVKRVVVKSMIVYNFTGKDYKCGVRKMSILVGDSGARSKSALFNLQFGTLIPRHQSCPRFMVNQYISKDQSGKIPGAYLLFYPYL